MVVLGLPDYHYFDPCRLNTCFLYRCPQNFKRAYRCLAPATEEAFFVLAPSMPKPYSMSQFSAVVTDHDVFNFLSKPIRLPKFDRGPPPCPTTCIQATPWAPTALPRCRPRTCTPRPSRTPIEAEAHTRPPHACCYARD